MDKIVIIGFGAAGSAAFNAIRRAKPSANVTVIDQKNEDLFHTCGLPFALAGEGSGAELAESVLLGKRRVPAKVVSLDLAAGSAATNDGTTVSFDKLIVATGSAPVIPNVSGAAELIGKGVFTLSTAEDLIGIQSHINSAHPKRACVIGGGAAGIEAAAALARRGMSVTLFEAADSILPQTLDADIAALAEDTIRQMGVTLCTSAQATSVEGNGKLAAIAACGKIHQAELCIAAAGSAPRTVLLDGQAACAPTGVIVNRRMETSAEAVFAAGDCAQTISVIDGNPIGVKLAPAAYRQGEVAGLAALGLPASYAGTVGAFACRAAELEIAAAGFTSGVAGERGFEPVSGKVRAASLPAYMGGGETITVKIIADKTSGKILGGQGVGAGALWRINLLGEAIRMGLTIDEFARSEPAYCPSLCDLRDPLLLAVEFCARRI